MKKKLLYPSCRRGSQETQWFTQIHQLKNGTARSRTQFFPTLKFTFHSLHDADLQGPLNLPHLLWFFFEIKSLVKKVCLQEGRFHSEFLVYGWLNCVIFFFPQTFLFSCYEGNSCLNNLNIIGTFTMCESQVFPSPEITAVNNMEHILPVFPRANINNTHKYHNNC